MRSLFLDALILMFVIVSGPVWVEAEKINSSIAPRSGAKAKRPASTEPLTPEENKVLVDQVAEDFYKQGVKAMSEGRIEQAEGLFDRVLILLPNHRGAKDGIEKIMKKLDQEKPAAKKPDPKAVLIAKLQKQLDQSVKDNDWEESSLLVEKILAVDPGDAKTKQKAASIHQQLYLQAVRRGQEREKSGDLQGALDAYQVAANYRNEPSLRSLIKSVRERQIKRKENKSEELYRQALAASQDGKYETALQLCRRALSLNPKHVQAQRMSERLKLRSPR